MKQLLTIKNLISALLIALPLTGIVLTLVYNTPFFIGVAMIISFIIAYELGDKYGDKIK